MSRKKSVGENEDAAPAKTPEQREAERRARFMKHAERRVRVAVKRLIAVSRLANRANYSYQAAEANAITEAISAAATDVMDAFNGTARRESEFTLFQRRHES